MIVVLHSAVLLALLPDVASCCHHVLFAVKVLLCCSSCTCWRGGCVGNVLDRGRVVVVDDDKELLKETNKLKLDCSYK